MAIKRISVIGLGTLGTQIAIQAAYYGYEVRGYDQDPQIFPKTIQKIKGMMKFLGKNPTMGAEEWEKGAGKVKMAKDLAEAVKDGDLVIEVVPEVLELKRKVWAEIDSLAPKGALLATNSSSIPVSRIESATRAPGEMPQHPFLHAGGRLEHRRCDGRDQNPSGGSGDGQAIHPLHPVHSAHREKGDPGLLLQQRLAGDQKADPLSMG